MLPGKVLRLALTSLLLIPVVLLVWAYGLVGESNDFHFQLANLRPLLDSLKPVPKYMLLGALLGVFTCLTMTGVRFLASKLFPGGAGEPPVTFEQDELTWPAIFILALSSGFVEELVFRGTCQPMVGFWPVSIVFGLVHLTNLKSAGPYYFLWTFAVGLFLGWAFMISQNLWLPIVAHVCHNGLALALQKLTTPQSVPGADKH